jgi:hypothetical protein
MGDFSNVDDLTGMRVRCPSIPSLLQSEVDARGSIDGPLGIVEVGISCLKSPMSLHRICLKGLSMTECDGLRGNIFPGYVVLNQHASIPTHMA